ncbi:hypothetical protein KUTeg_010708 [Tegillarca granosa]|uniref:dihydrofolate reductase n=1 Tax=Tegillarca granosa TaxID=220873 RepID=A0ABQ9F6W9_TEGGR|nr:hypothetical protein KUTeg_010708 [Tegillarca granosa]
MLFGRNEDGAPTSRRKYKRTEQNTMANVRLNLVVAACNNRGIGVKGQLPWRLKKDMQFFKNVTTETKDPDKQNAVIMGRITYFSIPEKFRPLAKRKNIILSRELKEAPPNTSLVRSLDEAVSLATGSGELADKIEKPMESNYNCRIYLTRVLADIDCDTFFPELDENLYRKVDCEDVPTSVFTENGLDFKFEVYDKVQH